MSKFQKATKQKSKLRLALHGPSGAGKTYTALNIATHLGYGKVAVIDTEEGSASKYSDIFDFDVLNIRPPFHPDRLIEALGDAVKEGYSTVIVDSLTHFWNAQGGLLELVDQEAKRSHSGNTFTAWKSIDPIYRRLIQAILQSQAHVIFCMRSKMEYEQVKNEKGKMMPRKVGMAPEFRDQASYEADIEAALNIDHDLIIGKTRCSALDGGVYTKAGKEVADILRKWLDDGVEAPKPVPVQETPKAAPLAPAPVDPKLAGLCDQFVAEVIEAPTKDACNEIKRKAANALGVTNPLLMTVFRPAYLKRLEELPETPAAEQTNGVAAQ